MKLLRIRVDGFGPLRGDFSFDPNKVNLVVDENERGKSSLLAAVAAALYGLDDDRRSHRVLTPLERWRPWDGGVFRVELEIERGGEHFTIARDFDRGTVAVFNGSGKEITEQFREGKEDFPVGKLLLGVDSAEFEKSALVRQGDLDQVVPGDEKARRGSTLRARLENAADTHIGDTNATEAMRVLEEAQRRYTDAELGTTVTVENAIKALEAKRLMIESEIKTLDHDFAALSGPLEEMAKLADEERRCQDALRRLEAERHETLATEVRARLAENDRHREELEALREEAKLYEAASHLPANIEGELRETVARYEEAVHNLETLETRRREELAKERGGIEAEAESLKAYNTFTADDADRCVSVASELRRVAVDDANLRTEAFTLRDQLAGLGYEPERIQYLNSRFGGLPEEQQRLLRGQSEVALAFQTEVATLEIGRTEATEKLREIDAVRNARIVPGWVLFTLGLVAVLGGVVVVGLHGTLAVWASLFAAGTVCALAGGGMLLAGGSAKSDEREDSLRQLSDAQRRINQLRTQRTENEVGLAELSRTMGYRDTVDLMRQWSEYARMTEDSSPLVRAQEQLTTLEQRRRDATEEARTFFQRIESGTPTPEQLERIAYDARRFIALRQRLAELEKSWQWIEDEKRVAEAAATGLKERAVRILQSAGLSYDPSHTWPEHLRELNEKVRAKLRYQIIIDELIPRAEGSLLSAAEVEDRRRQLETLEGGRDGSSEQSPPRPQLEIEAEGKVTREKMEAARQRRHGLELQLNDISRRYAGERPEKESQLARVEAALGRAQRYKAAIELAIGTIQKVAIDTHRRWADFLNQRVVEIMASFGAEVDQLRFGEDLDFSVQMEGGPQVTRGKAHLQLSSGARDQLYLAVRLAISEFLSRGKEKLPLLLDDAFATSDDQRLRAGMRTLLQTFGGEHQIILVTCHRGRHKDLRNQEPELFAERVHWLDVRTSTTAARG